MSYEEIPTLRVASSNISGKLLELHIGKAWYFHVDDDDPKATEVGTHFVVVVKTDIIQSRIFSWSLGDKTQVFWLTTGFDFMEQTS